MAVDIAIERQDAAGHTYLTWSPRRARVRLLPGGAGGPVAVTVANAPGGAGGQVEFAAGPTKGRTATIDLVLPADGSPVELWVAGRFGRPSTADQDATIEVRPAAGGAVLGSTTAMVRVRKDATRLSTAERDRFLVALAAVNAAGQGPFASFREMHRERLALQQAHGAPGFLAWHRAYLLDLERVMQAEDPSVTLPYWSFASPAPNLLTPDFMGGNLATGRTVVFAPMHPLQDWTTDGVRGISRRPQPLFDPASSGAISDQGIAAITDARTMALGGPPPTATFDTGPTPVGGFGGFDGMEGNPHGTAHRSMDGYLFSTSTAPRDPLFFLLHCNVDRLWARWQWQNDRFDGTNPRTYFYRGSATSTPATRLGHNLRDSMWPWNGRSGGQLPPAPPPRPPLAAVPTAATPGPSPTVGDMIDYGGVLRPGSDMDFAYDLVPFGVAP
jgi:tyrosinase